MNIAEKLIHKIDGFQRRYRLPAFSYAVVKKYGDDKAGYQAALLTYYGFLSLFPLLLVLTTVAGLVARNNPHLQKSIIDSLTSYFPVLGTQLSSHIQTLHKSGLALIIGILFTLYGARGVADAFRHGVNHIWQIPIQRRDGSYKAILKSLSLIVVGGLGLLVASVSAGIAGGAGHGLEFRLLSLLVNVFVLFWLFVFLLNVSLPRHVTIKEVRLGAVVAAIGLVILQSLGSYLLARELKSLDALYSNFAIPLGLLFWIYLQAQVIYYAVEVATVHVNGLWPRSLSGKDLTDADKRAYTGQAKKEKVLPEERVDANFRSSRP